MKILRTYETLDGKHWRYGIDRNNDGRADSTVFIEKTTISSGKEIWRMIRTDNDAKVLEKKAK